MKKMMIGALLMVGAVTGTAAAQLKVTDLEDHAKPAMELRIDSAMLRQQVREVELGSLELRADFEVAYEAPAFAE